MIDPSVLLTFDGTVIAGLFVFYGFFVILAERFDKARQKAHVDRPIRILAVIQLFFITSAMLALFDLSNWATAVTIFGLFLLVFYSLAVIFWTGLIQF